MGKIIELSPSLEAEMDRLVADGTFSTFQTATEELIRMGIASLRTGRPHRVPPGSVPIPEKPTVPDPSRDILKM